jgi:HPt (histidine-containing phosphotransfer) domain-containing protein
MSELPDIDVTVLGQLARYCTNPMLATLIDTFLQSAPRQLAEAESALAAGDLDTVARAIHSLRSGVGTLGAVRMAPLAATIEAVAKAGDAAPLPALLADLRHRFAAAHARLLEIKAAPDLIRPAPPPTT